MRAVLAFAIGVLAVLGTAGPVASQEGPGGRVLVAGVSLGCADFRGKPVQTYETSGLGDVARSTLYGRIPVITVDKEVMASLSGKLQIFFYLHECAHHVLGHMFAPQPSSECRSRLLVHQNRPRSKLLQSGRRHVLRQSHYVQSGERARTFAGAGTHGTFACVF